MATAGSRPGKDWPQENHGGVTFEPGQRHWDWPDFGRYAWANLKYLIHLSFAVGKARWAGAGCRVDG